MCNNTIILGAGIAGIGAGYKLGNKATIYEERNSYGGLCDNFTIEGFRFDYAVHLSFTQDETVRSIINQTLYFTHNPISLNYCDGYWVKHPVQNNTFSLPVEERVNIIKSFINRDINLKVTNYEEWLSSQYGKYFAEKYPGRYTKKYWCLNAKELSVDWVNNRMYLPSLDEVLYGAMSDSTPNTYYAKEMRYPVKGGFKSFLTPIAENLDIKFEHKATSIEINNKIVTFSNGNKVKYKKIISSLPLPKIISMIDDCPIDIINASRNLYASSICLVSIGFNKKIKIPSLWYYVYDEDILYARAYSPSMKSNDNVPIGKSSLQFEIYYSKYKPLYGSEQEIRDKIVKSIVDMKIANASDIQFVDIRHVEYANVIYYHGMAQDRKIVLNYLNSIGIQNIGRFGKWDYFWSDQSFMSGYLI